MSEAGKAQNFVVRKPEIEEAGAIHDLLSVYARERLLLPRTMEEIYETLRDFFVCVLDGRVIGCGALHFWGDLAEVRSLAVAKEFKGQGVGRMIVEALVEDARRYHVREIFALTFQPGFFEKMGFKRTDKERFPHKIWNDCVKCPHFPDCGEVALMMGLR